MSFTENRYDLFDRNDSTGSTNNMRLKLSAPDHINSTLGGLQNSRPDTYSLLMNDYKDSPPEFHRVQGDTNMMGEYKELFMNDFKDTLGQGVKDPHSYVDGQGTMEQIKQEATFNNNANLSRELFAEHPADFLESLQDQNNHSMYGEGKGFDLLNKQRPTIDVGQAPRLENPLANFNDSPHYSSSASSNIPSSLIDLAVPSNVPSSQIDLGASSNVQSSQMDVPMDYGSREQGNRGQLPLLTTTLSPSNDLLSPNAPRSASSYRLHETIGGYHSNSNSLSLPHSPGGYSYVSDNSQNADSPFVDAALHFSDVPYQNTGDFDTEIALGGSILNTNLVGMDMRSFDPIPTFAFGEQGYKQNQSLDGNAERNFLGQNQDGNAEGNFLDQTQDNNAEGNFLGLTENNLMSYNEQNNFLGSGDAGSSYRDIVISIHQAPDAPEAVAAKTPSLFSNSSANSSVGNSPNLSQQNTGNSFKDNNNLNVNAQGQQLLLLLLPLAPNSQYVQVSEGSLLIPDEHNAMRHGRRKSHSVSLRRSTSRSGRLSDIDDDDGDEDDEDDDDADGPKLKPKVSSRQKMLELALPAQTAKRTQKHPLVYACHLCEKRFTRPYNLKSHLRTHTDERPFICNVCGKAFARQHDRKRHEELHTGEKKFQCKGFLRDGTEYGCGRKFARADALRRHFQTENGKACIKLLIEEEDREKIENSNNPNGVTKGKTANDFLMQVPQVVFSPPE